MSNTLKLISIGLFLIVIILSCLLYLKNKELEIYRDIQRIDSRAIEGYREEVRKQDSIINALYELKVTKITIIEKDTVR